MKLTLEFFGPLQDRMGGPTLSVELAQTPASFNELVENLATILDQGKLLQDEHIRFAVNDQLFLPADKLNLADGDRIAFLSPFSGG